MGALANCCDSGARKNDNDVSNILNDSADNLESNFTPDGLGFESK